MTTIFRANCLKCYRLWPVESFPPKFRKNFKLCAECFGKIKADKLRGKWARERDRIRSAAKLSKTAFADSMRAKMTPAEAHLWGELSKHKEFSTQEVVGGYIADFCSHKRKLIVEVDGGVHNARKAYDARRTKHLSRKGFRVIRFTNAEVLANRADVLKSILQ